MRKNIAAFALVALALAGCGATGEDEATESNTSAPSTSKITSSATPKPETSSETPDPESPVEQPEPQAEAVPAEQPAVQAPTVVGCENHGGSALMSDGSTAYSAQCDENAGGLVPGNGSPYGAAGANAAPTFVRCYLADGTALMSDGSTIYMESCNESAGGPMLLEDGTSIYDHFNAEAGGY